MYLFRSAFGKAFILIILTCLLVAFCYIVITNGVIPKHFGKSETVPVVAMPPEVTIPVRLDAKSEWKSYTNPQARYGFMYPKELDLVSGNDMQDVVATKSNGAAGSVTAPKVHITVNKPVSDFNKMYDAANNTQVEDNGSVRITKIENKMVNNVKGVTYKYDTVNPDNTADTTSSVGIMLQKNNMIIGISSWDEDASVYEAILPTFHML